MAFSTLSKLPFNQIKIVNLIGSGSFGDTYKANYSGKTIVIKKLLFNHISATQLSEFENEAQIIASLRSERIVQLYSICVEPGNYALVTDYFENGSLYKKLHEDKGDIPWSARWRLAIELAEGVSYLHEKQIIHANLKSKNVLLDSHQHVKLSDFGFHQTKLESSQSQAQTNILAATIRWQAPELFKRGAKPNTTSDIYSTGMILWEIAARKIPYKDAPNEITAMGWIKDGEQETIPSDCPYADIINRCWSSRVGDRPDAYNLVTLLRATQSHLNQAPAKTTGTPPSVKIVSPPPVVQPASLPAAQAISTPSLAEEEARYNAIMKKVRPKVVVTARHQLNVEDNPAYYREIEELEKQIPILQKNATSYSNLYGQHYNTDRSKANEYMQAQLDCITNIRKNKERIEEIHKKIEAERAAKIQTSEHSRPANTMLRLAAEDGDFDRLYRALCDGALVDDQDQKGQTALKLAATKGHLECVLMLLENGAKLTKDDINVAAMSGFIFCLKAMLKWHPSAKPGFDERMLGLAYRMAHYETEAIKYYTAALNNKNIDHEGKYNALCGRGKAYFQLNRKAEAAADLRLSLDLNPNQNNIKKILDEINAEIAQGIDQAAHLQKQGKASDGIKSLENALVIDPGHLGLNLQLAIALFENGQKSKASQQMAKAIAIGPKTRDQNSTALPVINNVVINGNYDVITSLFAPVLKGGGREGDCIDNFSTFFIESCIKNLKIKSLEVGLANNIISCQDFELIGTTMCMEDLEFFKQLFKRYNPDRRMWVFNQHLEKLKYHNVSPLLVAACEIFSSEERSKWIERVKDIVSIDKLIPLYSQFKIIDPQWYNLPYYGDEIFIAALNVVCTQADNPSLCGNLHPHFTIEKILKNSNDKIKVLNAYIKALQAVNRYHPSTIPWGMHTRSDSDYVYQALKHRCTVEFLEALFIGGVPRNLPSDLLYAEGTRGNYPMMGLVIAYSKSQDKQLKQELEAAKRSLDNKQYNFCVEFAEKWPKWNASHPGDWRGLVDKLAPKKK